MYSNLPKHHCRLVSSDHRVCSNNDSTSDSTSHAIACDDFTRSCNLIIGLHRRYNNLRYYCLAEKLMFTEIRSCRQNLLCGIKLGQYCIIFAKIIVVYTYTSYKNKDTKVQTAQSLCFLKYTWFSTPKYVYTYVGTIQLCT